MLRRMRVFGLVLLSAGVSLSGCSLRDRLKAFFQREEHKTAVVKIADRAYTKAELDRFFEDRLSEFRDPANTDVLKSNLLDSFVEEKLLLCQAEQHQSNPNGQTMKTLLDKMSNTTPGKPAEGADVRRTAELERNLSDSLKVQQYLHDYLLKGISVTDDECEAYYKEHLPEYVRNDVVRVREILVGDLAQAQKLLSLLKAKRNKNFADLARVYSKGASAPDGGDLGTFQKGELPEEFEKDIFPIAPGNVSRIVSSRYGYHIFLVEEKVLAHQQRLVEVREQIREKLLLDRERDTINKELSSLISRIPVEVYRDRLDFNYIGTRFSSPEGSKR